MKLFFILGNQLFPIKNLNNYKKDHIIFMAEDYELCSYERHHKLKILLFLSSMRSYSESLRNNKYKIDKITSEEISTQEKITKDDANGISSSNENEAEIAEYLLEAPKRIMEAGMKRFVPIKFFT